ncbi:hypothetical protein [Mastigocoleus testarum]|uniref:hypothetical protein n=1 Tax=Mastigocoleus testarum TaxID=996925 RepID=UPI0003FCD997|nr:hypothetical protein [Mastigocoleus testarum]
MYAIAELGNPELGGVAEMRDESLKFTAQLRPLNPQYWGTLRILLPPLLVARGLKSFQN